MKLSIFLVAAAFTAFAACKTPYKATDRPTAATDTTTAKADTSSMNQPPANTDSTRMPVTTDSTLPTKPDSTSNPAPVDSTKKAEPDSTTRPSTDSSKISPSVTPGPAAIVVPATITTTFTTQYPTATEVVWANYDSLAAVPIDLRMADWEKMDAEDYMATFEMDNEKYYAWYNSEGKWIGSAYKMDDISKLPAPVSTAVKNAIKTKYTGYTISNVNREFQKDKKAYEVELIKDDSKVRMLVNSNGKITQVFKYVSKK